MEEQILFSGMTLREFKLIIGDVFNDSLKAHLKEKSQEVKEILAPINVDQTAEFLDLAKSTVYGMVQRGEIPYMKKGKRLYFNKQELINWLETGKRGNKRIVN